MPSKKPVATKKAPEKHGDAAAKVKAAVGAKKVDRAKRAVRTAAVVKKKLAVKSKVKLAAARKPAARAAVVAKVRAKAAKAKAARVRAAKAKVAKATSGMSANRTKRAVRPSPQEVSFPFPFLGSGRLPHDELAHLVIWFATPPDAQVRAEVIAALPCSFVALDLGVCPAMMLETIDNLADELETPEAREAFDRSVGEALVKTHARHPIVFVARVPTDPPFVPDAWHAWSLAAAPRILDVIESDTSVPASVIAAAMSEYLDETLEMRVRLHLMASGLAPPEDVGLFAALLVQLDAPVRTTHLAPVAPIVRVGVALAEKELRDELVARTDGLMASGDGLEIIRRAGENVDGHARENAGRIRALLDHLLAVAVTDPKRSERALALAEVAIVAANNLYALSPAWTASRWLIVTSLRRDFPAALVHLPLAARDHEGGPHAIGTALAQATTYSFRPLVDACVELALKDPTMVQDRIVVANLLGELAGKSRFEEATQIASAYLEATRLEDATWPLSALTPVLVTNAVLAFAHANDRSALAAEVIMMACELADTDDGAYFVADLPSDIRGSAHAWIALWHLAGGNIAAAVQRFHYARAAKYRDLALMRNQALVHPHLHHPALADIFAGEEDAAIREKTTQIEANPRDWWAHFSRGLLHHERGDIERALADYNRTIELNPQYADVYVNIGNIHFNRDGNHPEAIRWYDLALARADKLYLGRLNRAEARLHTGDHQGVLEDTTAALSVHAAAAPHYFAALAHHALGDHAAAISSARAGHSLEPAMESVEVETWRETLRALL